MSVATKRLMAQISMLALLLWGVTACGTSSDGSDTGNAPPDVVADVPPFDCGAATGCIASDVALPADQVDIAFLHHSTGEVIWNGGVAGWFAQHNAEQGTHYNIEERYFPKDAPYGWENYPYDYWNIWVQHAGAEEYMEEPTLELLTPTYEVIVWKHCFPVSDIQPDEDEGGEPPDISSPTKSLQNYRLQYQALKAKMHEFGQTRFIVWTGAARIAAESSDEEATRARAFAEWVKSDWDEPGDNIFIWDFRQLETDGDLFLPEAYSAGDSHPNETLASLAAPLFAQRIVDVIEGRGDSGNLTGE